MAADPRSLRFPFEAPADEESGRASHKERLLELAMEAELWTDQDGEPYASFEESGHWETWPVEVRGSGFRQWLVRRFYERYRTAPSAQALAEALEVVKAEARYGGDRRNVHTRVGAAGGAVVLDLCDAEWHVVIVERSGWHVGRGSGAHFRRARGMLGLPEPVPGGSVAELRPFVNVGDDQWPLLVAWLVAALRPTGPYPVLCLQGEQGSAKSTTARVLRSLVDPSAAPLRTAPRDERDLMIQATNSWVVCLDNLSGTPEWLSNAICRLATGGGLSTRRLYADAEEQIFSAMRPVILNGIEDVATRADLLDRSLVLNLPTIPDERRRDEASFWREWERVRPRVLGALLDAVAAGLRNVERVKLSRLPRMADFARWVVAAEPALPWPAGAFMEAYAGNRADAVELALEADPVAQAVRELAERGEWTGTASELLDELEQIAPEKVQHSRTWPTTARTLANRLRRAATFLRALGVEVEFRKTTHGRREVAVRKNVHSSAIIATIATRGDETEAAQAKQAQASGGDRVAQAAQGGATEHVSPPVAPPAKPCSDAESGDGGAGGAGGARMPLSSLRRDVPPGDPAWSGAPWREGRA